MSDPRFLDTATTIAAQLCRDAVWWGKRCSWLGDRVEYIDDQSKIVHAPLGPDVYGGLSGVALFLAEAWREAGEPLFRHTAEAALTTALGQLDRLPAATQSSVLTGTLGVALVSLRLGRDLDLAPFRDAGLRVAADCARSSVDGQLLDVITGSAGGIPAYLALFQVTNDNIFLEAAKKHGQHLLQHAEKAAYGWSWRTSDEAARNLCGYAHGTAGIGLALLELYHVIGEDPYWEAACHAFRYEQHWYDVDQSNYPDFRRSAERPGSMRAWCHGGSGIALARARAFELTQDETFRRESELALASTLQALSDEAVLSATNFSLCHGLAGDAAIVHYVGEVMRDGDYRRLAARVGESGLTNYRANRLPWPSGILQGGSTPGLMLGSSGLGLFYLTLYVSRRPSFLLFHLL